ncbi:PREDICTED: uncharacterized protein LOC108560281 [Nicrophorus vespilloides]|uniref:Uncharacterized protein LOC108560281 n=1 Tax=Nicrophorus vespilloides TaxID=110193 RepID=A0ABM1MF95_NICVS|nr:PREDICTED: uncharacterized protein LOC108560281 [Nicrophorus vespilloides]
MFAQSIAHFNENADVQVARKTNVANIQRNALADQSVNQHSHRKVIGKKMKAPEVQIPKEEPYNFYLDVCSRNETDEETYEEFVLSKAERFSGRDVRNILYKYTNNLSPSLDVEWNMLEREEVQPVAYHVDTLTLDLQETSFEVPKPDLDFDLF